VLDEEEKDVGTALLDLGGGTSDLAIFSGKNIKHTFVLSLGGNNLTNDISIGLRTSMADAEKIKKKYGTCVVRNISADESIEVPGMGGRKPRKLPRQILGEILEPRMEEIFTLIKREVLRSGMDKIVTSGLVLTGGSSLLEGVTDVAEMVFDLPTRLGTPKGIRGLTDVVNNPMYATGVGLVIYGARNQPKKKFRIRDTNIFNRVMTRMKRWFKDVM
jgi:cell division protein FtsA